MGIEEMKYFIRKGQVNNLINMTSKNWKYYFSGITIKNFGFGVFWREKIKAKGKK
jgi:hypothetical protein